MSGAQSISTRRAYGVQRVCRVWARPRSSVYARRQAPRDCARGHRRGPVGAAPDEVLVGGACAVGCWLCERIPWQERRLRHFRHTSEAISAILAVTCCTITS